MDYQRRLVAARFGQRQQQGLGYGVYSSNIRTGRASQTRGDQSRGQRHQFAATSVMLIDPRLHQHLTARLSGIQPRQRLHVIRNMFRSKLGMSVRHFMQRRSNHPFSKFGTVDPATIRNRRWVHYRTSCSPCQFGRVALKTATHRGMFFFFRKKHRGGLIQWSSHCSKWKQILTFKNSETDKQILPCKKRDAVFSQNNLRHTILQLQGATAV